MPEKNNNNNDDDDDDDDDSNIYLCIAISIELYSTFQNRAAFQSSLPIHIAKRNKMIPQG